MPARRLLLRCCVAALLLLGLSAVGTATVLWGQGYRVFAVRTGSMSPTFVPGDLVVDAPARDGYDVGNVITFRNHSATDPVTTHRLHARTADGLRTKGDANATQDVLPVAPRAVVGRVVTSISHGGYALVYLQQPAGVASAMTLLFSVVLAWQVFFPTSRRQRPTTSDVHSRESLGTVA